MNFFWKYWDWSQNICEVLTQWAFVPLGIKLTHITLNLNNLRNFPEGNKCIDINIWNHKNRYPHHKIPQTCGGRKSIRTVWIRPTDNFLTNPRTSFGIKVCWSNNMIHTGQQPTKGGFNEKLEGYFIPIKEINWSKKVWTPNQHPLHNLSLTSR